MDGNTRQTAPASGRRLLGRTVARAECRCEDGLWTVPAARMKRVAEQKLNGQAHLVPLAKQTVQLLRELQPLAGSKGEGAFVFPGARGSSRPLSENSVRMAQLTRG